MYSGLMVNIKPLQKKEDTQLLSWLKKTSFSFVESTFFTSGSVMVAVALSSAVSLDLYTPLAVWQSATREQLVK